EFPSLGARYSAAKAAGFHAVESYPYAVSVEELVAVKQEEKLEQVLINSPMGTIPSHDPSQRDDLLREMQEVYVRNMKYAADRLQKEGILVLIEAINTKVSIPGYFLDNPYKAIDIIKKINHDNLKLMLDLFHAQIMVGNLTYLIKTFLPYIGHVQVAQVPNRGEPDSPGEINYTYIFKLLEDVGYDGYIGCEYTPTTGMFVGLSVDVGYDGYIGCEYTPTTGMLGCQLMWVMIAILDVNLTPTT
uniref:Putative hydroxypyruvate isomerase n=1 Tax=Saccoglossus kowalevskii TaxID=10224 RepID=A0ABM0ML82_SACKO